MTLEQRPKAVITGANGFLGSHLIDFLCTKNYEVHAIVRPTSNLQWLPKENIHIHSCGLNDVDSIAKVLQGAAYVFHLAGTVKARKPEAYHYGNVVLTENVLQAASQVQGIQNIVVTSSLAAAGPSVPGQPLTEQHEPKPLSLYGKSKLAQEACCHTFSNKLPICIIRPPVVYGPRDTEVLLFFKTYKKGIMPMVKTNAGMQQISLVYVADLVQGLYLAAINPQASSGNTYFIAHPEIVTWAEMGQLAATSLDIKPAYTPHIPHGVLFGIAAISQGIASLRKQAATLNLEKAKEIVQPAWTCSPKKAKLHFSYQAEHPVAQALPKTINWYKAQGWL